MSELYCTLFKYQNKNTYRKNTYDEYRHVFVISSLLKHCSTYNEYGRTR